MQQRFEIEILLNLFYDPQFKGKYERLKPEETLLRKKVTMTEME